MFPPPPTSTLFPYTTLFRSRRIACEGCRHVVDITPSLVVVDHAAHRQSAGDQREIDDCRDVGIGVTARGHADRKSTRLNSSHRCISYAVFCLKKKKKTTINN